MCDSNKKKNKSKSKPKSVASNRPMLTTDAVPTNDSPASSNGTQSRNENIPPHPNCESDRGAKNEGMPQNHKNPLDQNTTMIVHNISISHCGSAQVGHTFYHSNPQKNESSDGNNRYRAKEMSKSVSGIK